MYAVKNVNRLRDDVERWLIHENYSFKELSRSDDNFCMLIKNIGSYRVPIEIFEPKKQPGVLVLGGKVFLKNPQTARYLKLNDSEQKKFHGSVKDYCNSIQAVHKIFQEDGKVVVEVYVILDKVNRFTQQIVLDTLVKVAEMSEKTNRFIMKTF